MSQVDSDCVQKLRNRVALTLLLELRNQARQDKNWKRSDDLRDQISERGYQILDTSKGAKLKKK